MTSNQVHLLKIVAWGILALVLGLLALAADGAVAVRPVAPALPTAAEPGPAALPAPHQLFNSEPINRTNWRP